MTNISREGRRELLALIDGFESATRHDGAGAHSLRAAVQSGAAPVRDEGLREAILHDPWAVEECLVSMSRENLTVDRSFILFGLHVLFGWDTPHKRQRIDMMVREAA